MTEDTKENAKYTLNLNDNITAPTVYDIWMFLEIKDQKSYIKIL
jgi:hypothetical protein